MTACTGDILGNTHSYIVDGTLTRSIDKLNVRHTLEEWRTFFILAACKRCYP